MIATWDSSTIAGRGPSSDAEAAFKLVTGIAGWGGVEDALISIARAVIRADGSTQGTTLAIKLCAGGTTFYMPRSLVGRGHNLIKRTFYQRIKKGGSHSTAIRVSKQKCEAT